MADTIKTSEVIRIDIDQLVETGDSIGKTEADQGIHKIIRRGKSGGIERMNQNFERQSSRGDYRNKHRNESYGGSRDRNRSKERSFSRDFSGNRNNRSTSNSRSRSG